MHTKRIIPCLDIKDGRVVKGVNFVDLQDAGDPVAVAAAYDAAGADEVVFLDITASSDHRETVVDMVRRVAEKIFIPFTVVVSAVLKIADMDRFEIYVYSYHFFSLNFSFLVARAAIIVELALGIGLISNCFHKLMWWGSVLMLVGYTGLLVYALVLGRTDNCHCFGDYLQFNPWQSITLDYKEIKQVHPKRNQS